MIIITGINGFIAKHLYNSLKSQYDNIVGTTKDDSSNIIDILEFNKPEYIYHVGAEIYDNEKMFESNIILTYKILEYCRRSKNLKRLILFGSSSEFGRKKKPMSEEDNLEPDTIYEGTKAACAMLARSYSSTYKIPILLIRPFTIYGPYEKSNKFIQILFRKKQTNDRTVSISNGVHDYVYIDDFINAVNEIVNKNNKLFDTFNIGSGKQTSNHDLVKIFENITGYKFKEYNQIDHKAYDSNNWVSDITKISTYYNINISLEEGIKRIYNSSNF